MQYYAKTNTADPRTGMIHISEVLTEAQEEALGEEKLAELVQRGVLGILGGEAPKKQGKATDEKPVPETEEELEEGAEDEDEGEPEDESEDESEGEAEEEGDDDAGDGEGEMPELSEDDVVEEEKPAKPARKGKGGKTK